MTRVYFISDLHIANFHRWGGEVKAGINRRCEMALSVLATAAKRAVGSEGLVVLGDVFDTIRPEPQVIYRVDLAFGSVRRGFLVGNHDQASLARGDHSLGPLHLNQDAVVHEVPGGFARADFRVVMVPFQPRPAEEYIEAAVSEQVYDVPGSSLLAIHAGIIDRDTPAFLRNSSDAVRLEWLMDLCQRYKFDACFAGNWHKRRQWSLMGGPPHIMQVGALVPTGFDNPGMTGYGTLAWWDLHTKEPGWKELPGPRFVHELPEDPGQNQVFVSMRASGFDATAAEAACATAKAAGRIVDYEILPDVLAIERAASAAVWAVTGAKSLEEQLALYVEKTMGGNHSGSARVLKLARKYLGL